MGTHRGVRAAGDAGEVGRSATSPISISKPFTIVTLACEEAISTLSGFERLEEKKRLWPDVWIEASGSAGNPSMESGQARFRVLVLKILHSCVPCSQSVLDCGSVSS